MGDNDHWRLCMRYEIAQFKPWTILIHLFYFTEKTADNLLLHLMETAPKVPTNDHIDTLLSDKMLIQMLEKAPSVPQNEVDILDQIEIDRLLKKCPRIPRIIKSFHQIKTSIDNDNFHRSDDSDNSSSTDANDTDSEDSDGDEGVSIPTLKVNRILTGKKRKLESNCSPAPKRFKKNFAN